MADSKATVTTFRVYRMEFLLPEPVTGREHTEALFMLDRISTKWINWQNRQFGPSKSWRPGTRMLTYLDGQS